MARPFLSHPITDDSALGGAVIENSLKFRGATDQRLERTLSSTSSSYTVSMWFKGTPVTTNFSRTLFSLGPANNTNAAGVTINTNDGLTFNGGNGTSTIVNTDRSLRDTSAWYNFIYSVNSNNFTAYINGVSLQTGTVRSLDTTSNGFRLGGWWGGYDLFQGYIADFYLIDGLALTPSNFGYTEFQTEIWRPKKYTGSFGTSGAHLLFNDDSGTTATTMGKDSSGNGNNFTPLNNFATSDVVKDNPTNNYPTLNPLDMGATNTSHLAFSNGNLQVKAASSVWASTRATFAVSSGKWYWEVKILNADNLRPFIGVIQSDVRLASNQTETSNELGSSSTGIAYWIGNPIIRGGANTSGSNTNVPTSTNNDIVGVALDMDNKKVYFSKNGTFFASQDPANNAGEIIAFSTSMQNAAIAPAIQAYNNSDEGAFNFGQRPFSYTPPTGYRKLNSNNLPPTVSSITSPQKHFKCVIWTGNTSTSRDITGVGFAPDLVSIKARVNTYEFLWFDTVRGAGKRLFSHTTSAESDNNGTLNGFISDGFRLGNGSSVDLSVNGSASSTYVAWCWKAGGAAVSNSDGSVTSQVSANQEAGFSIVTYNGSNDSTVTFGHGLDSAPELVWIKRRNNGNGWRVYHHSVGLGKYLSVSNNSATTTSSEDFASVSATTFGVKGGYNPVSINGGTYVAYCWHSVPGYSKIGSFTGNGNANAPFVYTGFRPAYILFKNSSTTTNWEVYDTTRPYGVYNPALRPLYANRNYVEETHTSLPALDILSNGFKPRSTWDEFNKNNDTILYMAFAEQPGTTPYDTQTNAR